MKPVTKIAFLAMVLVGLFLGWRMDTLSTQLALETERHKTTAQDLRHALEENGKWNTALDAALQSAEAHKGNTAACMERENRAQAAAEERSVIMRKASPRPKNIKDTVLDDETRARIVHRLNRPL